MCTHLPETTCGFLIQLVFCKQQKKVFYWCWSIARDEVEAFFLVFSIKIKLFTSCHQSVTPFLSGAPPPKKIPGFTPNPCEILLSNKSTCALHMFFSKTNFQEFGQNELEIIIVHLLHHLIVHTHYVVIIITILFMINTFCYHCHHIHMKTSQIHSYRTRSVSSDSFYIKFSKTGKIYAFFLRIGAQNLISNSIPYSIKLLKCSSFRKKIKELLLYFLRSEDDFVKVSRFIKFFNTLG